MARANLSNRPIEIIVSVLDVSVSSNKDADNITCDLMVAGRRKTVWFTTKPKAGKKFVEERLLKASLIWD